MLTKSGEHRRPRALIVDDDEDLGELLAWCLRAAGWVSQAVIDGEDALHAAAGFEPDVVVMDLLLPRLDGLQAIRLLKSDEHTMHVPIVVCSAVDRLEGEILAKRAGCEAFVAKPCDPDVLRALLEDVVVGRTPSTT